MPVEIRVPVLGESGVEAVVGKWLKNIGDAVAPGDPVVELETDKVNLEVPAEQGGVLAGILKKPGDTVGVGEGLGTLGAADGAGAPNVVAANAKEDTAAAEGQTALAATLAAQDPATASTAGTAQAT